MFTPKSLDHLPLKQWLTRVILFSLAAGLVLPLAEVIAVTDWFEGVDPSMCFMIHRAVQLIWLPTIGFIAILPVWLFLLLSQNHERKPGRRLVYGALFAISVLVGYGLSCEIRHSAFQQLAVRSQFLIDAINEYEEKIGYPPSSVRSLVPYVLDTIPETGMAAYPEYKVVKSCNEEGKTEWMVYVSCPNEGLLDWDEFVYLPDGDYQRYASGNAIELTHGWAYIND